MVELDETYKIKIGYGIYENPPLAKVLAYNSQPTEETDANCPNDEEVVFVEVLEVLKNPENHEISAERYAVCESNLIPIEDE